MSTEIKEFTKTEAALSDLESRYKDVPDCTTKAGYSAARNGISELRGYRVTLDKSRLALGKDARDHITAVNKEAARIIRRLTNLEDPLKAAKKTVDDEKARAIREAAEKEAARIKKIEFVIDQIKNSIFVDRTVDALKTAIDNLDIIDVSFCDEFIDVAKSHKREALDTLNRYMRSAAEFEESAKKEQERLEEIAAKQAAQQLEIDAQQAEAARKEREAQEKINIQQAAIDKAHAEIAAKQAYEEGKKAEAAPVKQEKVAIRVYKVHKVPDNREAARVKQEEEAIIADKKRFHADANILLNLSVDLHVALAKCSKYDNPESVILYNDVYHDVVDIIDRVNNSPIVLSQK
ncbi:MAG TPA: hypothetical protein ENI67_04810 [Gammaproteobacteria bacterium]|nr:hypothetical protein [Gammaproteobacteria bacterium]